MSIPAFVNVHSGSAIEALRALDEFRDRFSVHALEPDAIGPAIRAAIDGGATRVAVAGGDGTVATAASILAGSPVELAVIGGGTLNHFVRDLGIPRAAADAVRVASEGTVTTVDLGIVNGRRFINTSSVGVYVTFVRARMRFERRLGYRLASILAALRILPRLHSFRVTLARAGQQIVCDTPLVFVGVGERSLAPPELGARIAGGHRALHLVVVTGRRNARRWAHAYDRGLRVVPPSSAGWSPSFVTDYLVDAFRVEVPRRRGNVAVDGEIVPMEAPLAYELWRDAVRVVVPRQARVPGDEV